MTTHLHFIVASYAVFGLAIIIEVMAVIKSRKNALNNAANTLDSDNN
jgi:heme exporter protein D